MSGEYIVTCNRAACGVCVCLSSSVVAHSGTVWCLQHKKEVLVTGSHDKTVSEVLSAHNLIIIL